MVFEKNFFLSQNLFEELKNIRQKHRASLEKLSREIKVPIKYLENLEAGRLDLLPDFFYTKNILKKYLGFFKINAKLFLKKLETSEIKKPPPQKKSKKDPLIVLPRFFSALIIIIFVFLFILFLGFKISEIFKPPMITIFSPPNGAKVEQSIIEVIGKTEGNTLLTINDAPVLLDKTNGFKEEVNLQKGLNLIKIAGVKRYSKERIIWLNINLEIK